MTVHTIWKLLMMFSPPLRCPPPELLSFAAHLFSSWSPIQRSRCANGSGARPWHTESPRAPKVCSSTGRQHILPRALGLGFFSRCTLWIRRGEWCFVRLSTEQCVFAFLSALWFIKVSHGLGVYITISPKTAVMVNSSLSCSLRHALCLSCNKGVGGRANYSGYRHYWLWIASAMCCNGCAHSKVSCYSIDGILNACKH